ncbi:MAG: STAS/SEC14 domain-containing protein [Anaerolinea sp.]
MTTFPYKPAARSADHLAETPSHRITYTFDPVLEVHRIVFLESSREAVEDWVAVMDAIYAALGPDDAVRFLFDERPSGALPLTNAINRGVRWARSLEYHPPARVAFLFPDRMIASLANSMLGMVQRQMGHLSVRLFNTDQEAQAIAWLTDPHWPAK